MNLTDNHIKVLKTYCIVTLAAIQVTKIFGDNDKLLTIEELHIELQRAISSKDVDIEKVKTILSKITTELEKYESK